jgi:uncharacterized protein YndB with AHSA1/START domain
LTVQVTRTFPAPREQVFRAWTDPESFRQWFGPFHGHTPRAEMEVRTGGSYRIELKPTLWPPVFAVGTYIEVKPPERLVFTLAWESDAALPRLLEGALHLPATAAGRDSRVTVDFLDRDGLTEVRLTHELLDRPRSRAYHRRGWRTSFDRLAELLAR